MIVESDSEVKWLPNPKPQGFIVERRSCRLGERLVCQTSPRTWQGRKANNENLALKETSTLGREVKDPLACEQGKEDRHQVVLGLQRGCGIPC